MTICWVLSAMAKKQLDTNYKWDKLRQFSQINKKSISIRGATQVAIARRKLEICSFITTEDLLVIAQRFTRCWHWLSWSHANCSFPLTLTSTYHSLFREGENPPLSLPLPSSNSVSLKWALKRSTTIDRTELPLYTGPLCTLTLAGIIICDSSQSLWEEERGVGGDTGQRKQRRK